MNSGMFYVLHAQFSGLDPCPLGVEPPWQVWKIVLGIAVVLPLGLPLGHYCNPIPTLADGKSKGKNAIGQHFVLLPFGIPPEGCFPRAPTCYWEMAT